MRDPRPVCWLLLLTLAGSLCLGLWWVQLPPAERSSRLLAIATWEHVALPPPLALLDQPGWLFQHRLAALSGLWSLGVAAAIVGIGEGIARRRRDVLGGFRLGWWTAGVLGLTLVVCSLGVFLMLPWPVPLPWVESILGALTVLSLYGLCSGRPYIP